MSGARRLPRALARGLLLAGGLIVGLLGAEGVARFVEPPVGGDFLLPIAALGVPDGLYQPHPRLRSAPTPGFEGSVRTVGHEVAVRINSAGCRGPEPTSDRPRWIAVGDSFTIALQVDEADTFAQRLGQAAGIEVLNCGVDGYSTYQAMERYRLVDDATQASGVLLVFFLGNDLSDNARTAAQQRATEPPPPPPVPREPSALERWLITHSHLYGYGHLAIARMSLRAPDDAERARLAQELGIFAQQDDSKLAAMLEDTRRPLTALRDEVAARGDRLVVAVAPPVFAVDEARAGPTLSLVGLEQADPDAPRRAVLELLEREGIQACDLTPALEAAVGGEEHPYLLLDGHWSTAGHAVVAEVMAGCLGTGG